MADKISTVTAYSASAGASVAGWMTLNDFALWVGIVCAIITAGVNYWFKRKQDVREEARYTAIARFDDGHGAD